ncbi:hypothetical protein ACWGMW_07755 [Streptomyces albidoflavus]
MIETQPTNLALELGALAAAPPTQRGPRCSVGVFIGDATPDEAAALRAVLETPDVSSTAIAEALNRHGSALTAYTVARHRRRGAPNGCRCPR